MVYAALISTGRIYKEPSVNYAITNLTRNAGML
jgi:hypothetical protein